MLFQKKMQYYKKWNVAKHGVSEEDWKYGMEEESEHDDITGGDEELTARIVLAHVKEDPMYYKYLKKMVMEMEKEKQILYDMAKAVFAEILTYHSNMGYFDENEIASDILQIDHFTQRKNIPRALQNFLYDKTERTKSWNTINSLKKD